MPHFFVSPGSIKGDRFILRDDEAHHLAAVLRKKPGDEIGLFDGKGNTYRGRISVIGNRRIEGSVVSVEDAGPRSFGVRLFQALPKGDKFDWILQKAAELGVGEIVPIYTERTVMRIPSDRLASRRARWQKIVLAASQQSGQPRIPVVSEPKTFREALGLCETDTLTLLPWEGEEKVTLKQVLRKTVLDRVARVPSVISLFIGPEGGFSPHEIRLAREWDAVPVSLGPAILRTETAGFFVASILFYEFGEGR